MLGSMTQPIVKKRRSTSSWSRAPLADELPDDHEVSEPEAPSSSEARPAGAIAGGRAAARRVSAQVGRKLRDASSTLMEPAAGDLEGLFSGANLPELDRADPLLALARRLDREGDLWRALALRALARAGWADRFTQATAVVGAVGCVALAAVAALGGLLAASTAGERSLLVLTGCASLVAAGALVAATAAGIRRAQHAIAREALRRADLSELRLHRLALVLAAAEAGPDALTRALARLEHDVADG
jgi:hypothetical protein